MAVSSSLTGDRELESEWGVWSLLGGSSGEGCGQGLALLPPCLCRLQALRRERLSKENWWAWALRRCRLVPYAGTWLVVWGAVEICRNVRNQCSFHLVSFAYLPVLRFPLCLSSAFLSVTSPGFVIKGRDHLVIIVSLIPCMVPGT